jgi:DNA-binding NtrC family response regulator
MMRSKRVLIVDDAANVTLTLAASLEKLGSAYTVETAQDGDEALGKIRRQPFDLVITDYKMPGLDGLDLAQAVREIAPQTQIVLMTAYGDAAVHETVQDLALEGYLDKPFDVAEIRRLVARALPADEAERDRHVLVMEDNRDLRRIYSRALRREGYRVQAAATLQEARDLIAQQRFDAFLCDVHIGNERGTDLLREVGPALHAQGTQIIMVSADARYRSLTEELGVEFYMEKPVDIVPLVTLVDRLTASP